MLSDVIGLLKLLLVELFVWRVSLSSGYSEGPLYSGYKNPFAPKYLSSSSVDGAVFFFPKRFIELILSLYAEMRK